MEKIYLAFDIDGTIFDSEDILVQGFQIGIDRFAKEYKRSDIETPGLDALVPVLGIPVENIFQQIFSTLNSNERSLMGDFCTDGLVEMIGSGGGRIFENAQPVIKFFFEKGYGMVVASNGRPEYIEAILKANGLIEFFSEPFVYLNEEITSKGEILRYYKENVIDNKIIMIGDRYTDRDAALENNIPFIGCAFGHAGDSEIKGADQIVHSFIEIPEAVDRIIG